jgi:hypothetical protein
MIHWFLNRQMKAYEREFNYDISYARDILDTGRGAFWTFSRILSISSYRKGAPLDAWYAAKIAATIADGTAVHAHSSWWIWPPLTALAPQICAPFSPTLSKG